jgi:hypothetical protein
VIGLKFFGSVVRVARNREIISSMDKLFIVFCRIEALSWYSLVSGSRMKEYLGLGF